MWTATKSTERLAVRVFLDDVRPAPEGWHLARWPEDVIALLETHEVTEISLDHDIGDDPRTGYDVFVWIEEAVALRAPVRSWASSPSPIRSQRS